MKKLKLEIWHSRNKNEKIELQKKHDIRKYTGLMWSLGITIILWLVTKGLFSMILYSVDDIMFRDIALGNITGSPYYLNYFQQAIYSAFVASLYKFIPAINWYELIFVFELSLCVFLICVRIFDKSIKGNLIKSFIFFVVYFLVLLNAFVDVEWTTTAAVLGATALFRFCTIPNNLSRKKQIFEISVCVLLVMIGWGLRKSVIMMFAPLFAIVILLKLIECYKNKRMEEMYSSFLFITSVVVCVGISFIVNKIAYSSDEWKTYSEYTKNRSLLCDYNGWPSYEENEDIYTSLGITKAGYQLMSSDRNYLITQDEFSQEAVNELGELSNKLNSKNFKEKMNATMKFITSSIQDNRLITCFYLLIVFCGTICIFGKRERLIIIISSFCAICIAVALAYKGRYPYRVYYSLVIGMFGLAGAMLYRIRLSIKLDKMLKYSIALFTFLLVFYNIRSVNNYNSLYENYSEEMKIIMDYCARHSENIYLRDFKSFSQMPQYLINFDMYKCGNYISVGGWYYHSPIYEASLENNDISSIIQRVKEKSDVYYLVNRRNWVSVGTRINEYLRTKKTGIKLKYKEKIVTNREVVYVAQFVSE